MDLIVSIKNATEYTPHISQLNLPGTHWLPPFQIQVGQPIGPNGRAVGILQVTSPFRGWITIHFTAVTPGPVAADVTLNIEAIELARSLAIGFDTAVVPAAVLTHTDANLMTQQGDRFLLLEIR